MIACRCGMEDVVLKALDNKEACKQSDIHDSNIGMLSVVNNLERASLKALENVDIRKRRDYCGKHMTDYVKESNLDKVKEKVENEHLDREMFVEVYFS